MVFIMNREGTIVETVTSPVHQGSNANEILLLAPFAPTNTVTVGFKLPNGILIQPRLSESGTGETMTALEVNNLFLKIGADEESMSAWYIKINRDLTRYSGELGIQFFIYDGAGDILASSYATVTVQKGVAILDGTTFDTGTATQLQAALDKVYAALTAVKTDVGTLQTDVGTLQTDVSTLQTDMSGAKDEITILKGRMELAETDIGTLQTDMSVAKDDIADLKSSKLDKTGGTISGNLEVTGNLNVLGKTIESVLEKLNVKDAVIVTNADGSTLTVLSGFATRTGSNTTYGIMYDPASDSVKLGIVTVDENGVYRFADGDGSPVATRADSADMADGKIVTWNTAKRRMETTTIPAVVDSAPTNGSSNLVTSGAVWQSEEDLTSLILSVGNGWGIHYEKDYDMLVLRNGFTSVESTVVLGIKDINDRVDFLSTLLFNTIITNTTVEDTYTSRVTAGGLPVVSNTPTTVHKIAGDTVATEVGLKHASFKGVTSVGKNLINQQNILDSTRFSYLQESDLIKRIGTSGANGTVVLETALVPDTYTACVEFIGNAPTSQTSLNVYSNGANIGTIINSNSIVTNNIYSKSFTSTYPDIQIKYWGSYSDYSFRIWIVRGNSAVPYEKYIEDTSFQLSVARQLRKWDYIDIDNQRVVTGTAEVTQDTAFTDEELATYPAGYILSADRKTIAYPLETPTTAPLTVPKSYTAWRNGSETVDTGATDALPPTITQTYYEEVTA